MIAHAKPKVDFGEVRGQEAAKRALTIAAAGAHNVLMLGPAGTGKTTLLQAAREQLDKRTRVAYIFNTDVTFNQMLLMVLVEFGLALADDKLTKVQALQRLNDFAVDQNLIGGNVAILIDEAQNLCAEALEEVRMLSNLQSDNHILLQIMLVGQPELKAKLHDPSMRQFAQRIAVNYHLTGLNLEETSKYIAHRLQIAGGSPQLFTPKAAEYIYKLSAGIPRSVNIACQAALVYGYADESQRITQDIVRQIINDKVGISLDIFGKKDAEKAVEKAHLKPSNGIQRHLENLESEIRDIKNLVSDKVNGSGGSAKTPRDELVERLIAMLDVERRRNHDLAKQVGTLELKITAALSARKKLEKYIYHIRNTERAGQEPMGTVMKI